MLSRGSRHVGAPPLAGPPGPGRARRTCTVRPARHPDPRSRPAESDGGPPPGAAPPAEALLRVKELPLELRGSRPVNRLRVTMAAWLRFSRGDDEAPDEGVLHSSFASGKPIARGHRSS